MVAGTWTAPLAAIAPCTRVARGRTSAVSEGCGTLAGTPAVVRGRSAAPTPCDGRSAVPTPCDDRSAVPTPCDCRSAVAFVGDSDGQPSRVRRDRSLTRQR